MKELIDLENLKYYRDMGNITENRYRPYIREAQRLDIIPAITQKVFDYICSNLTDADVIKLLDGGAYEYKDTAYSFAGLKAAISMFTYSRMIRNNSVSVTSFGVVSKSSQDSQPASGGDVVRAANEAFAVGVAYLKDCVDFIGTVEAFDFNSCGYTETPRRRRFTIIGD